MSTIGELVDRLGVEMEELPDETFVMEAVVILRLADPGCKPTIAVRTSAGVDWVMLLGMLRSAALDEEAQYTALATAKALAEATDDEN